MGFLISFFLFLSFFESLFQFLPFFYFFHFFIFAFPCFSVVVVFFFVFFRVSRFFLFFSFLHCTAHHPCIDSVPSCLLLRLGFFRFFPFFHFFVSLPSPGPPPLSPKNVCLFVSPSLSGVVSVSAVRSFSLSTVISCFCFL